MDWCLMYLWRHVCGDGHAKLYFAYLSGHRELIVVACSCCNAVVPSSDEAS